MPDPRLVTAATQSVNQQLLDRAIRHATFLERLKARQVDEVLNFLDRDVFPDLLKRLGNRLKRIRLRGADSGVFTTQRYKDMVAANNKLIQAGLRHANGTLSAELKKLALSEAEWQRATLARTVPLEIDFTVPSPRLLRAIVTSQPFRGALLKDWFGGLEKSTQGLVTKNINIGLAQGETIEQIVRRLKGTKLLNFTDGVLKMPRHQITSLVRTASTHVANAAREATYVDNSDVVKAVQYVATLDSRTTEICASLDGKVFPIGEGERPAMHHQCRSTTIPITKSFKELGIKGLKEVPASTRASMNGQVPAATTYPQWLKQQPVAVQNEVLGVGKARLWRQGKVKIEKFTDAQHRPLSLRQVIKREHIDVGDDATLRRLAHIAG